MRDPTTSPGMVTLWQDGRWIKEGEFSINPGDRGLLHGLGLFETILAVDGNPKFLGKHLRRLRESCQRLGWKSLEYSFESIIRELLQRNQLEIGRAKVRLALTAGSGSIRDLNSGANRSVWLTAEAAGTEMESIAVDISPWVRNERSPLSGLKCASYAENLLALEHARNAGFEETLFLNTSGKVCEAATANVFAVVAGKLFTPQLSSGCLPGITRAVVLELARQLGIDAREADIDLGTLVSATEVFLTSSVQGPVPVCRIGERRLAIGTLFHRIRGAWTGRVEPNSEWR
ncbi:aminotransferase class IV [Luteolibacter pohnpeiensis]|uniref:branched-chain-amino-acid transaminase n=1 Tax=Luteolibacter pohnpeiensis TaxID=454153 RepID=A0A934VQK0_9BACT|nr:aminotransferase class IV [Luteolibacter pohnpeiensis]MBK1882171.1 aminotransferase class IV [Luteolibacter pohnpeiensis]